MYTRKIIIYGNNPEFITQFPAFQTHNFSFQCLPANYPPEKLTYFTPFDAIFYQCEVFGDAQLETIRALRHTQPKVPLVLALPEKCSPVLVNLAYRYGVSDCVFAPYNRDELLDIFKYFITGSKPTFSLGSLSLVPAILRPLLQETTHHDGADLTIHFFGVLRLSAASKRFDLPLGPRLRSLLAYLLYYGVGTRIPRDRILQHFWPDHHTAQARNCLHVNITNLRRYLSTYLKDTDVICFQEESCFIHPSIKVWKDTDIFLQYFHEAKKQECLGNTRGASEAYFAATAFGSSFLEDMRQENWTTWPRDEFSDKFIKTHHFLADILMQEGRFDGARDLLRRILQQDDCIESVHRQVIKCYLAEGQRDQAIRHYRECERILKEKLNMEPSSATKALWVELRAA